VAWNLFDIDAETVDLPATENRHRKPPPCAKAALSLPAAITDGGSLSVLQAGLSEMEGIIRVTKGGKMFGKFWQKVLYRLAFYGKVRV
jgi:hypothetical protein